MIYGLKPNDQKTHKFIVENDGFATIQKSKIKISDPMTSIHLFQSKTKIFMNLWKYCLIRYSSLHRT